LFLAEILKTYTFGEIPGFKTFEIICSHFPQMFLNKKTYNDELFIFKIKYSLVHNPGEFFGTWESWNFEERNFRMLLQ
jgi:hypothetical protein